MRQLALSLIEQVAAVIGAVGERHVRMVQHRRCGSRACRRQLPPLRLRRNSLVAGSRPSVRIFLLSLVMPQPVALQRLNTGMRISSRIDGRPMMRTSPVWPRSTKTVIFVEIAGLHLGRLPAARGRRRRCARACASAPLASAIEPAAAAMPASAAAPAVVPNRPRRPIRPDRHVVSVMCNSCCSASRRTRRRVCRTDGRGSGGAGNMRRRCRRRRTSRASGGAGSSPDISGRGGRASGSAGTGCTRSG